MLSSYFKKLTEQIHPFVLWLEDTAMPFMQAVLMAVLFFGYPSDNNLIIHWNSDSINENISRRNDSN